MSQTWNAPQNLQSSKSLDYALVIAGWPTIYTVAKNYTMPTTAMLNVLSTYNGFTSTQAWADIPDVVGMSTKGRPEEGGCTIAQVDVSVLDRLVGGVRQMSSLLSHQSDLFTGMPQLDIALPAGETSSITMNASTNGFPIPSGEVYIGLECIHYTGNNGKGFTGLTRGYRFTSATRHEKGAFGYTSVPTLFERRAFIFKGYQGLSLDQWAPAFGGCIGGATKSGPAVTFTLFDTTWLSYQNGQQMILAAPKITRPAPAFNGVMLQSDVYPGDFDVTIDVDDSHPLATGAGSGGYLLEVDGHLMAITSVKPA